MLAEKTFQDQFAIPFVLLERALFFCVADEGDV